MNHGNEGYILEREIKQLSRECLLIRMVDVILLIYSLLFIT